MKALAIVLSFIAFQAQATTLSSIINDGANSVIVADKVAGKIYVFNAETKAVIEGAALYGKELSDYFNQADYDYGKPGAITPAGEFVSHKYYSSHLNKPVTAFVEGKASLVAIHPVWTGNPKQKRVERLHSSTSDDNRITNGCVNVLDEFYYSVLDKLKSNTRVVVLSESDTLINDVSTNPDYFSSRTIAVTVQEPVPAPILYKQVQPEMYDAEYAGAAGIAGSAGLR
jgi:hypothetical protein